ncbi:MAG: DoxX family protein [Acidobacteriia bacterium]|nr:DoxX family protein [Terriglobia bacterium]
MLRKLLSTPNDATLTLARIILAMIFFAHGSQKMFGFFGGRGVSGTIEIFQQTMGIPAPLTILAMTAEVFGALGLFLGLLSRIAASGVLVVMIVAPFANHLYPHFFMNWQGRQMGEGYEYHLLAIALIVTILVRGGGALSLDRAIASER